MDYTQHNNSTGTHNIDHLLNEWFEQQLLPDTTEPYREFMAYICQDDLVDPLGEPSNWGDESYKGYGHEWYYTTPNGRTIGIGFRFGMARLRGNQDFVTPEDCRQFLDWLMEQV